MNKIFWLVLLTYMLGVGAGAVYARTDNVWVELLTMAVNSLIVGWWVLPPLYALKKDK